MLHSAPRSLHSTPVTPTDPTQNPPSLFSITLKVHTPRPDEVLGSMGGAHLRA
ncbi:hypothetical protein FA13DRAFT_1739864 [Coprinellus micaceus]|uniref:Uncharacterized protein n=1 Tax=Coprinellus micaceus TaxID=71717 RepID=A0A4Y7SQZ6_COPMI|nr:hypothetical protein FA13DRAFT_1739864 [Coprinellus micaceus]